MCLALGGTWKPDDKDMIGRFGEGLKLTALALVRENSEDKDDLPKRFYIHTGDSKTNKKWVFSMMDDDILTGSETLHLT